jgi:hypothetical protein
MLNTSSSAKPLETKVDATRAAIVVIAREMQALTQRIARLERTVTTLTRIRRKV